MSEKPLVRIGATYHDGSDGHMTGLDFTVDYHGGPSSIQMLGFPQVPDEEIGRIFRRCLVALGVALQEVGQSSEGISWHSGLSQ
jgi:hypothetical protein